MYKVKKMKSFTCFPTPFTPTSATAKASAEAAAKVHWPALTSEEKFFQ